MFNNIYEEFDATPDEVSEIANENPNMKGLMKGYVAEKKLKSSLKSTNKIFAISKIDDHDKKKGDLKFIYKNYIHTSEAKSLVSRSVQVYDVHDEKWIWKKIKREENPKYKEYLNKFEDKYKLKYKGVVKCGASDKRKITLPNGNSLETSSLLIGEFDILAISLYEFSNTWKFVYCLNEDLERVTDKKYREEDRIYLLKTCFKITWPIKPPFVEDIDILLDKIQKDSNDK